MKVLRGLKNQDTNKRMEKIRKIYNVKSMMLSGHTQTQSTPNLNTNTNTNIQNPMDYLFKLPVKENNFMYPNLNPKQAYLDTVKHDLNLTPLKALKCEEFYDKLYNKHLSEYQVEQLYFHYICAIGDQMELDEWIQRYIIANGIRCFELFVNTPMYIPHLNYNIYPLTTALSWNSDKEIIRMLCTYGAKFYIEDQNGEYPEESFMKLPYFHPVAHVFTNADDSDWLKNSEKYMNSYRDKNDFEYILNEFNVITGEMPPPLNKSWLHPQSNTIFG